MAERPLPWISIAIGVVVGAVLAFGNCLIGLKTGLWDTAQLTSTLLTFVLCAPLCRLVGKTFDQHDNNIAQTTSAAIAAMPATMGLLGAVPALGMMGSEPSTVVLVVSAICFGMLGVASALLLAPRLIDRDQLPFPTGVATAEFIGALHTDRRAVRERAMMFGIAFAATAMFTLVRDVGEWVPASIETTIVVAAIPVVVGVSASPLLVGSGALIGARIAVSLAAGSLIAWLGGAYVAGGHQWATAESLGDWLRWPGVGLLLGGSVASLASVVRQLGSGARALGDGAGPALKIVGVTGVAAILVTRFGFDVPWLFAVVGVVIAVVLSTVAGRVAGATDIAPLGDVGQLAQFAGALSGSPTTSVSTANVTANTAAQSTALLWALKAGRILGTPVRSQWLAQVIGVVAGAPICIAIWFAVTRAWPIGSKQLPAPSAAQWKSVAEVLTHGLSALPPGAGVAALIALAVGIALSLVEKSKLGAWAPAPLGLGLGFLLPPASCLAIGIGGIIGLFVMRRRNGDVIVSSVGSGMLAGEAIPVVAVVLWQLL